MTITFIGKYPLLTVVKTFLVLHALYLREIIEVFFWLTFVTLGLIITLALNQISENLGQLIFNELAYQMTMNTMPVHYAK